MFFNVNVDAIPKEVAIDRVIELASNRRSTQVIFDALNFVNDEVAETLKNSGVIANIK